MDLLEVIARINALAKKQRETGLTDDEKTEQAGLRRIYIDNIKAQIRQQLDTSIDCGQAGGDGIKYPN